MVIYFHMKVQRLRKEAERIEAMDPSKQSVDVRIWSGVYYILYHSTDKWIHMGTKDYIVSLVDQYNVINGWDYLR
jgi:hypothetical protein